jgi:hypothetical protein
MYSYPENVIQVFAREFSKLSPYAGAGVCFVRYSPTTVSVNCTPNADAAENYLWLLALITFILMVMAMKKLCP